MKVVPIFSPEDQDLIDPRWYVSGREECHYAKRTIPNPNRPPKQILEMAHRIVAKRILGRNLEVGEVVDHINRNRLDNRRENLRITSWKGNSENRACGEMRGATYYKPTGKWKSTVGHNRKSIHVGYFLTQKEAADAAAELRDRLGFLK